MRRTCKAIHLFITGAVCVPLLGGPLDAATVTDGTGRAVTIADASRIVSIGGAVTEILYALGLEKKIVAVDSTSMYPRRALAEKPSIGYMRQVSPEGVLGLAPSLVLAIEAAGPKDAIAVLEAANISFVRIPDIYTGEGIVKKIHIVSTAVGAAPRGDCLASAVEADLAALAAMRARIVQPRRVLFLLSFMNGRPMVGGRNTAADGLLKLAGAANAVTEFEGYKIVNDEAIIAARPDMIVSMESGPSSLSADAVFGRSAFAMTPAGEHRAFAAMDGLYLLGFGPRTARAARDLAARLYPALANAELPSDRRDAADSCRP
jgi:iron complex transport system substrate-binding protein